MKKLLLTLLGAAAALAGQAQPAKVQKTNTLPVYVHYMPWFETPQTSGNGQWGWHWTMDNRNPNVVDASGKRQIASHFYPLIGPYASSDPDVVEYHLLLMKLSGIDGVLVDWYGSAGTNGDLGNLLRNSNALINRTDETGLKFGLILEDRFTGSVANGRTNLDYARTNYFNRPEYIRYGAGNDPLLGVFGPITFNQPSQWTDILSAAREDVEFLTLWDNNNAGTNADGQYVWPWEDESLDNYYSYMEAYYRDRAPSKKTVLGVAYPGFHDFYAQGQNGGTSYFDIPHNSGQTLNQTLGLVNQYRANIDMLQLATFNDFGEGTIFEPTLETGFSYLTRIQQYTGVQYTEADLRQVLRLYNLRKQYAGNATKQSQLNQAFGYFVALRIADAVAMLNTVEGTTPPPSGQPIPGTIQAESFSAQSGALTGNTSDTGGGLNVDYFDTGDWLEYNVSVATAGTYTVGFRVASAYGGATLQLRNAAGAALGSVNVGNTGGWQTWQTISTNVTLPAGAQKIRVHAAASTGCNVNWVSFSPASSPGFSVTLQAESANVNNGMSAETTTDAGGGQNMGWVDAGDYLVWNNINFPTTGQYTIEYRVASGGSGGTISSDLNAGSIQFGNSTIPGTGGWQNWQTVSKTVTINAGTYNFGIYAQTGGWNLNWVRITKAGARTALATTSASQAVLEVYPNPVTSQLRIQTDMSLTDARYQILDAQGRVVASGPAGNGRLDVAALRQGVYTLVLTAANHAPLTRRFVK
ncbi:carbohydrate-binding protein [Hymenobacter sp. J193]|uniref:carbohydrate-binding protein n=1 Tax=Hymenobacter sp. J193 TaxID=2898429 RepID=UPI002151BDE2|nr:carbohydrate-binding protein [Hymenobacter sp. J193]MCR5886631.1 carbohydrate-binding protein [Hymenobacter sp. J193]